ncbi:RNA-binding protein [Deferribacterales bacterium RsTz2092]|nr:RNA-binding protein [Deferribacterales bacterium]
MKRLFVGNLPFKTTDDSLAAFFGSIGKVSSARVIFDRATGRSKGFGFVEMDDDLAVRAVNELNDKELDGRNVRVSEAHEREQR